MPVKSIRPACVLVYAYGFYLSCLGVLESIWRLVFPAKDIKRASRARPVTLRKLSSTSSASSTTLVTQSGVSAKKSSDAVSFTSDSTLVDDPTPFSPSHSIASSIESSSDVKKIHFTNSESRKKPCAKLRSVSISLRRSPSPELTTNPSNPLPKLSIPSSSAEHRSSKRITSPCKLIKRLSSPPSSPKTSSSKNSFFSHHEFPFHHGRAGSEQQPAGKQVLVRGRTMSTGLVSPSEMGQLGSHGEIGVSISGRPNNRRRRTAKC